MKPKLFLTLLVLVFCMSAFFIPSFATTGNTQSERISVTATWMDEENLNIEVRDNETGFSSALKLSLSDYNCKTISVQAVDLKGNKSDVIQIANPYYEAPVENDNSGNGAGAESTTSATESESAIPNIAKPFTPTGTSSVIDNATENDGKEFFTINTEAGNEFYIIVDRQKASENVYLLNAVTENDLMALAHGGNEKTASVIPEFELPPQTPQDQTAPETPTRASPESKNNNSSVVFAILFMLVAISAGYYFKIYRPKHQSHYQNDEEDEYESDFEDESEEMRDDDYDYDDETEDEV